MENKKAYGHGGFKPSNKDDRDYSFSQLKRQKENDGLAKPNQSFNPNSSIRNKIPKDLLEREISVRLILGCPISELAKVRKAIKTLIKKYDVREVDRVETF